MSYLGQVAKRPRVEDEGSAAQQRYICTAECEQSFADTASGSIMNIKRWVWLHIPVPPTNGWQSRENLPATIKHYYVPEEIIDHIPSYKNQSQQSYSFNDNVNDERIIWDGTARDQQAVASAIRFLTSGYLVPLNASSSAYENSLHSLVRLYNLSVALKIAKLETALVSHIDDANFEAIGVNIFRRFARTYYNGDGVDTQNSSLGRLVKKKLSLLLPRLQQSMTAEKISSEEGVLGKQLIAVLFEDRVQHQITLGAVKREGLLS